jgi:hypothetical protein
MRAGSTLIERGTALAPFMGARGGPVTPDRDTGPRRVSPQLKVCNLSFSELSACGASFEFALADVLYGEVIKGWIQMPSAPESLEEPPQILKEWGRWGWGGH